MIHNDMLLASQPVLIGRRDITTGGQKKSGNYLKGGKKQVEGSEYNNLCNYSFDIRKLRNKDNVDGSFKKLYLVSIYT